MATITVTENQHLTGQEETEIHTRLLRLGLAEPDSRTYWINGVREIASEDRVRVAFEERWFGSRTMARVRHLVNDFEHRYKAFPSSLIALNLWNPTDIADRTLICHWHVQLSDPLYREMTSSVFALRWQRPQPTIDRTAAIRWVDEQFEHRWASATTQKMALSLLGCASEAGLCEKRKVVRKLSYPKVSDLALTYLLYLLKETKYEGNLRENPYLLSVGIDGALWTERLRRLPGVTYRSMSALHDLEWNYESLEHWAREVF